MRGRAAVGRAWIVDFLGALDQPGRLLRRVFDRNDLVIFTVLGNARRGVTRIVLATTGRPPYASSTTLSSVAPYCAAPPWRSRSTGPSGCAYPYDCSQGIPRVPASLGIGIPPPSPWSVDGRHFEADVRQPTARSREA